ncbi:MAG: acetylglutamate kinase [Bacteroidota bacterium]
MFILKIGGKILDDSVKLQAALADFAAISSPKILVHGGGKRANELCPKLGIMPQMIDGRRITDAATLEVVTMVYAGLLNKNVVSTLQALGCNALGLSGADANVIRARKRPVQHIDYGFAGDVVEVNTDLIKMLLQAGITPVLCSITHDKQGQLLNTNADTIATSVASALAEQEAVHLQYHFEKRGVLTDLTDETTCLSTLNHEDYERYQQEGVIYEGMIPKLDNAFAARQAGVQTVKIGQTQIL